MHHGCSWVIVMHVALVGGKVMVGLEVVFGCKNGAEVVMEVVFVAVEVGCDGHGDLGQRWCKTGRDLDIAWPGNWFRT